MTDLASSWSPPGGWIEAAPLVYRFEEAWQSGQAPRIDQFLPPPSTGRLAEGAAVRSKLLRELVNIDLEYRWRQASDAFSGPPGPKLGACGPRFEEYLSQYPELLALPPDLTREMIAWEYRVRHRWGDRPSHEEYATRFPQHGPTLGAMLSRIDAELAAEVAHKNKVPTPAGGELGRLEAAAEETVPISSVAALVTALQQCELVSPIQLDEIISSLQPRCSEPRALARELLQRNWLTPYQVNQLLQGRGAELVLGPYLLLARLGEGGAGQVFKAHHLRMQRDVALKVIRKDLLDDAEVLGRFYREIRVVGQFKHRNVVHAYDAGPIGKAHVLVMEYLEGTDLSRLVKQSGPLPVDQACDYIRQAALGLQHGHEHGLIHRDIKPSNLFLCQAREDGSGSGRRQEGVLKVLDFGLARLHRPPNPATAQMHEGELTQTVTPPGAVVMMGTPDYLAPEQAVSFHDVDIRADIYGLGCTFYYLLTGQPPFPGGTLAQKLVRHLQAEPPELTEHRRDVPIAVAAVLRQALAKRPENRFQTPMELAVAVATAASAIASNEMVPVASVVTPAVPVATLVPVTKGGPVAGSPAEPTRVLGPPPPTRRRNRRRRWFRAPVAGAVLALALTVAFLVLAIGPHRAPTDSTAKGGDSASSETWPLLSLCPQEIAPEEKRYVKGLQDVVAVRGDHRLRHWGTVQAFVFHPKDKEVGASIGSDGVIRVWNLATGRERLVLRETTESPVSLAFSPDGANLAVGGNTGLTVWEWVKEQPKMSLPIEGGIDHLTYSPDGSLLAGAENDEITLWKLPKKDPWRCLKGHRGKIRSVSFSADAKTLASCGDDKTIRLWDPAAIRAPVVHRQEAVCVSFLPKSRRLAVGRPDGKITFMDPADWKVLNVTENPATGWTADMKTLVRPTYDPPGMLLWDISDPAGKLSASLPHPVPPSWAEFSPDGQVLVTLYNEGRMAAWDRVNGGWKERFERNRPEWARAIPTPDGPVLVLEVRGQDGELRDLATGKKRPLPPVNLMDPSRLCCVRGNRLAQMTGKGILRIFGPPPHETVSEFGTSLERDCLMTLSGDGTRFAAASDEDDRLTLWDTANGKVACSMPRVKPSKFLALDQKATLLASAGADGAIRLWYTTSLRKARVWENVFDPPAEAPRSLVFSPSGRWLACSMAPKGKVIVLDTIAQPGAVREFLAPGKITAVAFDPKGTCLFAAGTQGVTCWEVGAGEQRGQWPLPGPAEDCFCPDPYHLVVNNSNGTVYVIRWKRPPGMQR